MNRNISAILFVVLLAGVSFYYNYHEILLKRPQSVHKWRQADCASIALNYYQDGMKSFEAETHKITVLAVSVVPAKYQFFIIQLHLYIKYLGIVILYIESLIHYCSF